MFSHILTIIQVVAVLVSLYMLYTNGKTIYTAYKTRTSTASFVLNQLTSNAPYYAAYAILFAFASFFFRHAQIFHLALVGMAALFLLAAHAVFLGFLKDHWASHVLVDIETEVKKVASEAASSVVTDIKQAL